MPEPDILELLRQARERRKKPELLEDPLVINPEGAADELEKYGASDATWARLGPSLDEAEKVKGALEARAGIENKQVPDSNWRKDIKEPEKQGIPWRAISPLVNPAEMALKVADAPARVVREGLTAYGEDRPVTLENLGKAALAPFDVFSPEGSNLQQGDYDKFITTVEQSKKAPLQALNSVGNAIGKYGIRPALAATSLGLTEAVPGLSEQVEKIGANTAKGALVDPLTYVNSLPGGSKRAVSQFQQALEREGVRAAPEVLSAAGKLFSSDLGEQTIHLVPELERLYLSAGGKDLRHLHAVAGKNLEFLGQGGLTVGLPGGLGDVGVKPFEEAGQAVARATGGRVSPKQHLVGRLGERLTLKERSGLPHHTFGDVLSHRAQGKNAHTRDVVNALKDIQENVLPLSKGLSDEQLARVAEYNSLPVPAERGGQLPLFSQEAAPLDPKGLRPSSLSPKDVGQEFHVDGQPTVEQLRAQLTTGPQEQLALGGEAPKRQLPALDEDFLSARQRVRAPEIFERVPPGGQRDPASLRAGKQLDLPLEGTVTDTPARPSSLSKPDIREEFHRTGPSTEELKPRRPKFSPEEQSFSDALGKFRDKHGLGDLEPGNPLETLPKALNKKFQSEQVKKYEAWVSTNLPDAPPEIKSALQRAFSAGDYSMVDRVVNTWKRIRLLGNPAFVSRNLTEDTLKGVMAGQSPRSLLDLAKYNRAKPGETVVESPYRAYSKEFLDEQFPLEGAAEAHSGLQKFGLEPSKAQKWENHAVKVGTLGVNKIVEPVERARDIAQRRSLYLDQLRKGHSPNAAGNKGREVLFDNSLPPVNPTLAAGAKKVRNAIPFANYALKSLRTVPKLAAQNPVYLKTLATAAAEAQREDPRDNIPANRHRTPGMYFPVPESARDAASQGVEQLSGEPLDAPYGLTMTPRGTPLDFAGNPILSGDTEGLQQVNPIAQGAYMYLGQRGPFGEEKSWSAKDIAKWIAAQGTGNITAKAVNSIAKHAGGMNEPVIGFGSDSRRDPSLSLMNEILGWSNAFTPFGVSVSDPVQGEQEKAQTRRAKALKEWLQGYQKEEKTKALEADRKTRNQKRRQKSR